MSQSSDQDQGQAELAVFVSRDKHPAAAGTPTPASTYLGQLEPGTRSQVEQRLATIAELVAGQPLAAADAGWHALRYEHTQAIRAALAERYAPATVNVYLAALRGVLRECFRLGLMDHDQHERAAAVENISSEVLPTGRALQPGELRALFASCAAEASPGAARDAALIAVLYGAGIRRAEARMLELADYDPESGAVAVRYGKGRKQRIAYLATGARRAVDAWLAVRGDEPGPLLCPITRWGKVELRTMSLRAIGKRIKERASRAGVEHFSPHDCRRSFVSHLLDAGADIATVQKLAGHASPATTARYDRRGEETKARTAELLHVPFEG